MVFGSGEAHPVQKVLVNHGMPWLLRRFVAAILVLLAAIIIVDLIISFITGLPVEFWPFR